MGMIPSEPDALFRDLRDSGISYLVEKTMTLARAASFCVLLAVLALPPAAAQTPAQPSASPDAGLEGRRVKALSEEETADLAAGRGMGLALAAELNGYPGPTHVAELADALELLPEQRTRVQALVAEMKAETIAIGRQIIEDETALDRLFAEKNVTRAALENLTARIGAAQGELRAAHLRYHLVMVEVLSPEQVAHYAEQRGYATGGHRMHGTQ